MTDSFEMPASPRVVVDNRRRCQQLHVEKGLWCDLPTGHDGEHEAYYGWTGRSEVWS